MSVQSIFWKMYEFIGYSSGKYQIEVNSVDAVAVVQIL